ncbi:hypothetical protein Q673_17630 [Marinobacter sp. EN3]|jgi:Zn-dependent protease with chaperone function|nr:hypothetical protein Q673_17630 [Marinobacter sp. EN3]
MPSFRKIFDQAISAWQTRKVYKREEEMPTWLLVFFACGTLPVTTYMGWGLTNSTHALFEASAAGAPMLPTIILGLFLFALAIPSWYFGRIFLASEKELSRRIFS